MRDADIAMYRAKGESRGTYRVFNESMHRQVVADDVFRERVA